MKQLLEALNAKVGWDCVVKSYDGWRLNISSGSSAEYATPLATFNEVSYLSLPIEFSHPKFRIASPFEVEGVGKVVPIDSKDIVVAIEAETMASLTTQLFFVVASSVELAV